MKLHPEDPRLTAYLLGELSADEAAAVERAAAADPAVRMALREMESVQRLLNDTLAPAANTLLPRQREAIRRSARQAEQDGKIIALPSHKKSLKPWLIPLGAAAAIALGVFILNRIPSPATGGTTASATRDTDEPQKESTPADWNEVPLEIALLPAPGPIDASGGGQARPTASADLARQTQARDAALAKTGDEFLRQVADRLQSSPVPDAKLLPAIAPRGSVIAADSPALDLPIHAGRASLGWITHSIRTLRRMPPKNAVRLEEILNHFTIRPTGGTAIAQGATLSTEAMPCPWKPSATLLIISIRGAADSAREIQASYHADTANVSRYRLLGFAPLAGATGDGQLPSRLPAKAITTLAIEIEASLPDGPLGSLKWTVDGQDAAPVTLSRDVENEPSDDARFAALVCAYAQWLGGEQEGIIDADLVAALARENAADAIAADRNDFLNLVDQTLNR